MFSTSFLCWSNFTSDSSCLFLFNLFKLYRPKDWLVRSSLPTKFNSEVIQSAFKELSPDNVRSVSQVTWRLLSFFVYYKHQYDWRKCYCYLLATDSQLQVDSEQQVDNWLFHSGSHFNCLRHSFVVWFYICSTEFFGSLQNLRDLKIQKSLGMVQLILLSD